MPNREIVFVSFVRAMRSCVWARGGENPVAGVSRCADSARRASGGAVQIFPRLQFADRCWGFKRCQRELCTGAGVLRDAA